MKIVFFKNIIRLVVLTWLLRLVIWPHSWAELQVNTGDELTNVKCFPYILIRIAEFLHISLRREEEELLSGAPDEFLCPIMSILMTDPVSKCLLSLPADISMSFFRLSLILSLSHEV